jgi:adhesin/invasin
MILGILATLPLSSACDKVPLLAPTGSVINLFTASSTVPLNSQVEIIATVIENGTTTPPSTGNGGGTPPTTTSTAGSGTPVQNGTVVTFTTTIGRVEPREARTSNGEVRVKFVTEGQSGTATIVAYSGGTSGKLENILVGAAAVKRLTISASPQTLSSIGGSSEILARAESEGGTPLPGVPVTWTTSAGSVNPTTSTTDSNGLAKTTLTTAANSEVTGTSGATTGKVTVGVAAKSGLSVSAAPQTANVGTAVTFTITAAATANLVDARIEYGDGGSRSLGTLGTSRTDQHIYDSTGTFSITVTARDVTTGGTETAGTTVSVGALQVTLTAAPSSTTVGTPVTLSVGGTSTAQVTGYQWFFDDPGTASPRTTTAPQTVFVPSSRGNKTIRVDVIGITGRVIGSATTVIVVQ